jgi:hypothetical protein
LIEHIVTYRLTRDERETIYRYSDGDTYCTCDTSIGKDIRKLISKGWLMVSCDKLPDGTIIAARFTCPVELISPRTYKPSKPKRTISEEHRQKLIESRQK